jgi:hypothetical protein
MIVTKTSILFIDPIKMIIRHSYHRNELKRISVSEINPNLVAFHFIEKDDLIIETLRRFKMLNYFKKKRLGLQHIKINCTDKFRLEFHNNNSSFNFGKISLNRKSNANNKKQYYYTIQTNKIHLLPNFEEAIKFGYINKLSSNFGFKKFVLRFCVLTNIGLFIFETPNKNPKYLISLVNCKICKNNNFPLSFVFDIIGVDKNYTFSCENEDEMKSWINEIENLIKKYKDKLESLDVKKK